MFCTCHNKLHIHLLRVQICNVDVVVVVVVLIVIVVSVVVVAVGVVDNVHGGVDHGQDEANKSDGGELGKQRGVHVCLLKCWVTNRAVGLSYLVLSLPDFLVFV